MTHCKHGLIPQTCGVCLGLVTSGNQTREYGAGPMLSSRGLTGYMPRANREPLPPRESTEDIVPRPGGRPPTEEEMRETEQPEPRLPGSEEEEEIMEKPMCPKGCGRPSPGLRGDGQPKVCRECLSEQMRRIKKAQETAKPPYQKAKCKFPGCEESYFSRGFCHPHYDKWKTGKLAGDWPKWEPVKGKEPVKPAQNIPKNIPPQSGSEKANAGSCPDSIKVVTTKNPSRQSIGLAALQELQAIMDEKVSEVRALHQTALLLKREFGLDVAVKMPSLVG